MKYNKVNDTWWSILWITFVLAAESPLLNHHFGDSGRELVALQHGRNALDCLHLLKIQILSVLLICFLSILLILLIRLRRICWDCCCPPGILLLLNKGNLERSQQENSFRNRMHGANANTLHSQHCKPTNHGDQKIGRSRERHTHSIEIAKILVTLPKLLGIAPNKKTSFLFSRTGYWVSPGK